MKCWCIKSNNVKQDDFCNNTLYEFVVQQQGGRIDHFDVKSAGCDNYSK